MEPDSGEEAVGGDMQPLGEHPGEVELAVASGIGHVRYGDGLGGMVSYEPGSPLRGGLVLSTLVFHGPSVVAGHS
ncbi:hypothetical protein GCM10009670_19160 [Citricoccus alkalitolerans]